MSPATSPPLRRDSLRMLVASGGQPLQLSALAELPQLLDPGDVLVVNDAATLPASLPAQVAGQTCELRLLGPGDASGRFICVLFGAGSWRVPTEHRGSPPRLHVGDTIDVGHPPQQPAEVVAVDPDSPRLVEVRFALHGPALWEFLYTHGRAIQYAYLARRFDLDAFQTIYARRPWAAEMPSAGRGLSWALLEQLATRGIHVVRLTHAAGLSSTGDPDLDARLPLPERFEIPQPVVDAIVRARANDNRVIAVGTTVVRALEGSVRLFGELRAGTGTTDFRLSPTTDLRVVDSILTGMHGEGESHFELLGAFAPSSQLRAIWDLAAAHNYRCHEFGDLSLILRSNHIHPQTHKQTLRK